MGLLWFRRSRRREENEEKVPAPVRVRGLLLLNLGPTEGRDRIEHAPPLGPRAGVIGILETHVPGLRLDASGRGAAEVAEGRITIDLGPDDPVRAAVVAAEGEAAVRAVRALAQGQSWRIYVPRTGSFVEPDALETFAAGNP